MSPNHRESLEISDLNDCQVAVALTDHTVKDPMPTHPPGGINSYIRWDDSINTQLVSDFRN